jgi:hypothetical protein
VEGKTFPKDLVLLEKYDCFKYYYASVNCISRLDDDDEKKNCDVVLSIKNRKNLLKLENAFFSHRKRKKKSEKFRNDYLKLYSVYSWKI